MTSKQMLDHLRPTYWSSKKKQKQLVGLLKNKAQHFWSNVAGGERRAVMHQISAQCTINARLRFEGA